MFCSGHLEKARCAHCAWMQIEPFISRCVTVTSGTWESWWALCGYSRGAWKCPDQEMPARAWTTDRSTSPLKVSMVSIHLITQMNCWEPKKSNKGSGRESWTAHSKFWVASNALSQPLCSDSWVKLTSLSSGSAHRCILTFWARRPRSMELRQGLSFSVMSQPQEMLLLFHQKPINTPGA